MRAVLIGLLTLFWLSPAQSETILQGDYVQGGLIFGQTHPEAKVMLGDRVVPVSATGLFVFGFNRDADGSEVLKITEPSNPVRSKTLSITKRDYKIQRIDGLPKKMVTPPAELIARIKRENQEIGQARAKTTDEPLYQSGFIWPAKGRISGVYGSQRVLNGKPKRPHFGVDVAAPTGTPVISPADGIVRLAVTDHYYTGGLVILDHGQGLSSAFLHMSKVHVKVGQHLKQGDPLGAIGATGRATGPHLDWRMNWNERRVDPQLLVGPMKP